MVKSGWKRKATGCCLLLNADVITMDAADSRQQAIAVERGRIVHVGRTEDMAALVADGWPVYDLAGKAILPGFIDCHHHLDISGIVSMYPSGVTCRSVAAVQQLLLDEVKRQQPGQLVLMFGVNEMNLAEARPLNRWDLDAVSTVHPVVVIHYTGHQVYLNSLAIERFAISPQLAGADTQAAEVTGVIRNPLSVKIFMQVLAAVPKTIMLAGVSKVARQALQKGVTTIHSMQGGMGLEGHTELIQRHAKKLPVRLVLWEQSACTDKVAKLKLKRMGGCGELQADGEVGSYTAALFEPYENHPQSQGILNYPQSYWDELLLKAQQKRLQVAAHVEAEAGIEAVLSAIEKAQTAVPGYKGRHRLEHVELPTTAQMERMARAGVIASVQPTFLDMSEAETAGMMAAYGEKRMRHFNPLRSLQEHGVVIIGGSDSPVTPSDPLQSIYWAVNHPLAHERLSVHEALRMFTVNAAYGGFEEKHKGTIEVGKRADLVIVSKDPYTVAPTLLYDAVSVEAVMVGGVLYGE